MKALLGLNFLSGFTGSELVGVELAECLSARGWSVQILANRCDAVFAEKVLGHSVTVTDQISDVLLEDLDLIYIQHQMGAPIIHALANTGRHTRKWPHIVFMHLSVLKGIEVPSMFVEEHLADEMWCNSWETREHLIKQYGPKFRGATIFANPAPEQFSATPESRERRSELKSIIAVSNHFPDEVLAALRLLEEGGVNVVRRGSQFQAKRIVPEDLISHDGVITIGKTVQYALRSRCPVYCYDIHGGPGWLTNDNFEAAANKNFSGRSHPEEKTPEVIASELLKGFSDAEPFARELPDRRLGEYALEDAIERLEDRVRTSISDPKRYVACMSKMQDPQVCGNLRQEADLLNSMLEVQKGLHWHIRQRKQLLERIERLKKV